jgi:UDP-2,3-diacylglucosamine pyrophosphatase LpxH
LSDVARRHEADGIICGHIHHAADRMIDGVHYLNCGDWVESATAIVETHSGELKVLHWGIAAQKIDDGSSSDDDTNLAAAA